MKVVTGEMGAWTGICLTRNGQVWTGMGEWTGIGTGNLMRGERREKDYMSMSAEQKLLSNRIMAAAFAVMNTLGPGFLESVYRRDMNGEWTDGRSWGDMVVCRRVSR